MIHTKSKMYNGDSETSGEGVIFMGKPYSAFIRMNDGFTHTVSNVTAVEHHGLNESLRTGIEDIVSGKVHLQTVSTIYCTDQSVHIKKSGDLQFISFYLD